jgi:hypothetical protein
MKKALFLLCFTMIAFSAFSQDKIKWISSTPPPEKFAFGTYGFAGNNSQPVIISRQESIYLSGSSNGIIIRNYSDDFASFTEIPLPNNHLPDVFRIDRFNDYYVICGGYYEKPDEKGLMRGNFISQKIFFFDADWNLVHEENFVTENVDRNAFEQIPYVYISPDQSAIGFVLRGQLMNEKKNLNISSYYYIKAFDKNLNLIRNFNLKNSALTHYGLLTGTPTYSLELIDNETTIFMGAYSKDQKKSTLWMHAMDMKGDTIWHNEKILPSGQIDYARKISDGRLLLVGLMRNYYSKKSEKLFYYTKDASEADEPKGNELVLDEAFYLKYGLNPKEQLAPPMQLCLIKDGVLAYCEDFGLEESSSIYYHSKNLGFIKFDFSGNILWCKEIYRELIGNSSGKESVKSKVFFIDNELLVFYIDNLKNVDNSSKKVVPAERPEDFCLVVARVDADGSITKKVIDVSKESRIKPNLNSITAIEDGSFVIAGTNIDPDDKKIYLGKIVL